MAIRFCKGIRNHSDNFNRIQLTNNFFKKAHEFFLFSNHEYISVTSTNDKHICFCYNDEKIDKILNHIITLNSSSIGKNFFKSFKEVTIVSFNEISFYLFNIFSENGCLVHVIGDLWKDFIPTCDLVTSIIGKGIYCEGNPGLSLEELGRWRNAFPYSEYQIFEEFYNTHSKALTLYNNPWLNFNTSNELLNLKIKSGEPLMVARLGNTEAAICQEYCKGYYSKKWLKWLYSTSGFFSQERCQLNDVDEYARLTLKNVEECDIHLCRFENEIAIVNRFSNCNSYNFDWYSLYSDFNQQNTWLSALQNKNVLIISSISQSIQHQYNIKNSLF